MDVSPALLSCAHALCRRFNQPCNCPVTWMVIKHAGAADWGDAPSQADVLVAVQEDTRQDGMSEEEHAVALPGSWPGQGRISYVDVRLRYHRDAPMALNGLSLDIAPGQKLGICGRTGEFFSLGLSVPCSLLCHLCGNAPLALCNIMCSCSLVSAAWL